MWQAAPNDLCESVARPVDSLPMPFAHNSNNDKNNEHMKLNLITPLAFAVAATQLHAEGNLELKEIKDKASYAIGLSMGRDLHAESVAINGDAIAAGLKDGLVGNKPQITQAECREALTTWQKDQMEKMVVQRKEQGEKNKKEGEKFLTDNKSKEGVKMLPSGLQYKVLKAGTGAMPKPTSTVKVNCRGTLIDGTEFFSTYEDKDPATLTVNEVIKGWAEALPLMKAGSKWQLFVPADLAYGERGTDARIGPNATLIFEIELLSIES
jgi:FKBP-type peptidyl-prolyl cis-trans isomerase FklB